MDTAEGLAWENKIATSDDRTTTIIYIIPLSGFTNEFWNNGHQF